MRLVRNGRRPAALIGALVLSLGATGAAEAGCAVGNFKFDLGEAKSVVMTVTRLTKCEMTLNPGASVAFDSLTVTSQPHHGHIAFNGNQGISFTPGNTYVGPDAFAFVIAGHKGQAKATTQIDVAVSIQ